MIPPHLRPFRGEVTPQLTAWAQQILRAGCPIGTVLYRGLVAARVELHRWTWRDGRLVHGRFRGVTLYEVSA